MMRATPFAVTLPASISYIFVFLSVSAIQNEINKTVVGEKNNEHDSGKH